MNNRSREYLYETVNVWKESMRLEWVAAVTLVRGARGGATALPASVLSRGEVVLRKVTCRWTVCVCVCVCTAFTGRQVDSNSKGGGASNDRSVERVISASNLNSCTRQHEL